ncbi:MAG: Crp/Fnr family transcriptional regulator [Saprospiraceae bacterium]
MIKEDLLLKYGAVHKTLTKGEVLFCEGDEAFFFYQLVSGRLKMNNFNDEGQETIQGIFNAGESFGEPAILGHFPFPAGAESLEKTELICLEKSRFLQLLKEHPEISIHLLETLSKRLRFKAILSKEVKGHQAEHQILTLLELLKKEAKTEGEYQIEITRQTIANLTGLRVETVIRAIKKLEGKGVIKIIARKLYI